MTDISKTAIDKASGMCRLHGLHGTEQLLRALPQGPVGWRVKPLEWEEHHFGWVAGEYEVWGDEETGSVRIGDRLLFVEGGKEAAQKHWNAQVEKLIEPAPSQPDMGNPITEQPEQQEHIDNQGVDRFAEAMKAKLAKGREKGRGGWDDPNICTIEFLASLLMGHIGKGNPGNFEDIANLCMMLHQRGADPSVLLEPMPQPEQPSVAEAAQIILDNGYLPKLVRDAMEPHLHPTVRACDLFDAGLRTLTQEVE